MQTDLTTIAVGDVIVDNGVAMDVKVCCCTSDARYILIVSTYVFVRKCGAGKLWRKHHDYAQYSLFHHSFHQPDLWTFTDEHLLILGS